MKELDDNYSCPGLIQSGYCIGKNGPNPTDVMILIDLFRTCQDRVGSTYLNFFLNGF